MRYSTSLAVTASLMTITLAQRAIPSNIQSLYDSIKSAGCANFLQTGFYSEDGGPKDFGYCGDHLSSDGIIYLTGPGGKFANMDIDCDGQQHGAGDDGRCGSSGDTQDQTTWQDEAAQLSNGAIEDLNAFVHDYVVFGNDDTDPSFDPRQYGVEPLSVMAVVCGDKLVYGIWGDTNGNDGPPLVGEASISLATLCFGDSVSGDSGHDADDVLYIAFTGKGAVPQSAEWGAQSATDFESSIASLGDSLVGKIGGSGGDEGSGGNGAAPAGGGDGDDAGDGGDGGDDGSDSGDDGSGSEGDGDNGDDGSDSDDDDDNNQ